MKKKQKNSRKKGYETLKYAVILGSLFVCSTAVYGSGILDAADIGGFDMDIGEGTGQIPEDWEDTGNEGAEEENGPVNAGEEEKPEADPGAEDVEWDTGVQNDIPWEEDFQEESASHNAEPETQITENFIPVPAESPVSEQPPTPAPTIQPTPDPTPGPTPEPTSKPTPGSASGPTPRIIPELTIPPVSESEKAEKASSLKEKKPSFCAEVRENLLLLEINREEPFQILSLRINGKESNWHWKGRKILAELPKGKEKLQKAEILGFVKSGRLYHEIVDLTEKQ